MLSIRNMQGNDANELQGMIANMIGGLNKQEIARQELARYRSQNDFVVYVAEIDGRLAGFGVVKYNPFEGSDGVAELGLFQTKEEFRNRGIGTELLRRIETDLKARRLRKLYTTTNPKNLLAVTYWLKKGFEFEARLSNMNVDTDYYLLSKSLTTSENARCRPGED